MYKALYEISINRVGIFFIIFPGAIVRKTTTSKHVEKQRSLGRR